MSPVMVQDYLREVGTQWSGQGVAIELGSWLGATAYPLLEGLVQAGYNKPFYAYERWEANQEQVDKAAKQGVQLYARQNLVGLFLENIISVYDNVSVNKGEISETVLEYSAGPIEICILDAPKMNPVFMNVIKALSPYWIPGVTVLGLLDYHFYKWKSGRMAERLLAPVEFMEANKECFTKLIDWPEKTSAAFFKYEKKLSS